jgi:hypothetical protein
MARVVAAAWFPRSHIHLFETYAGLKKIDLDVGDVDYGRDLSFTIRGYKDYPEIRFTQEWSGLHYFTVEVSDDGVKEAAEQFMKEMQILLLQNILKACHSVTYKQIVSGIMELDFHRIILTYGDVDTEGFTVREADGLKVALKREDLYYSGTDSYVLGSDEAGLVNVLLYHAYVEVAFDMMYSMMKAMIRLYHEADNVVMEMGAAKDAAQMRDPMKVLDDIVKECSERYGKLKHAILNIRLKWDEYNKAEFNDAERELAEAFDIRGSFERLNADAGYMEILWDEVLEDRLRNIDTMLDARVMMQSGGKKGWF